MHLRFLFVVMCCRSSTRRDTSGISSQQQSHPMCVLDPPLPSLSSSMEYAPASTSQGTDLIWNDVYDSENSWWLISVPPDQQWTFELFWQECVAWSCCNRDDEEESALVHPSTILIHHISMKAIVTLFMASPRMSVCIGTHRVNLSRLPLAIASRLPPPRLMKAMPVKPSSLSGVPDLFAYPAGCCWEVESVFYDIEEINTVVSDVFANLQKT